MKVRALRLRIERCLPYAQVFNFWEPLHFADRGYGFQTWELSPAYAIRSWAYVLLHLPFTLPVRLLSLEKVCLSYLHTCVRPLTPSSGKRSLCCAEHSACCPPSQRPSSIVQSLTV